MFFTSDIHLFHKNILKFESESRPFSSLDEMHEAIIDRWNKKVPKNAIVYVIGDVTFGKITSTIDILSQLNGQMILIKGNHDGAAIKNELFTRFFHEIYDYHELHHNGKLYVLCHYPFLTWKNSHRGSINLFGHLHSKYLGNSQQLNVGMDCHNLTPIHIDEVNSILETLPPFNDPYYTGPVKND